MCVIPYCDGDVYIGGHFSQAIDLDPGAGTAMHTSGGQSDAFLLALDDAGDYRWSRSWPNAEYGVTQGVGIDAKRMVHAQINFYEDIDDAGVGELAFTAKGDEDVLLQRLVPEQRRLVTRGGRGAWRVGPAAAACGRSPGSEDAEGDGADERRQRQPWPKKGKQLYMFWSLLNEISPPAVQSPKLRGPPPTV